MHVDRVVRHTRGRRDQSRRPQAPARRRSRTAPASSTDTVLPARLTRARLVAHEYEGPLGRRSQRSVSGSNAQYAEPVRNTARPSLLPTASTSPASTRRPRLSASAAGTQMTRQRSFTASYAAPRYVPRRQLPSSSYWCGAHARPTTTSSRPVHTPAGRATTGSNGALAIARHCSAATEYTAPALRDGRAALPSTPKTSAWLPAWTSTVGRTLPVPDPESARRPAAVPQLGRRRLAH